MFYNQSKLKDRQCYRCWVVWIVDVAITQTCFVRNSPSCVQSTAIGITVWLSCLVSVNSITCLLIFSFKFDGKACQRCCLGKYYHNVDFRGWVTGCLDVHRSKCRDFHRSISPCVGLCVPSNLLLQHNRFGWPDWKVEIDLSTVWKAFPCANGRWESVCDDSEWRIFSMVCFADLPTIRPVLLTQA